MKILDEQTGQMVNVRATKKFLDDTTNACRASGLTETRDLKKYWTWYAANYTKFHIKKTKAGNLNDGCNIAKLAIYLAKKIGNGQVTCDYGPKFLSLQDWGTLSVLEYEKHWQIDNDCWNSHWEANRVHITDYQTFNIRRHQYELCQCLDNNEAAQVIDTFIKEPWLHVSKATNFVLMNILMDKALIIARQETDLPIKVLHVRKRESAGGMPFQVRLSKDSQPCSDPIDATPVSKEFGGRDIKQPTGFSRLGDDEQELF